MAVRASVALLKTQDAHTGAGGLPLPPAVFAATTAGTMPPHPLPSACCTVPRRVGCVRRMVAQVAVRPLFAGAG